jgi:hypothetical protein
MRTATRIGPFEPSQPSKELTRSLTYRASRAVFTATLTLPKQHVTTGALGSPVWGHLMRGQAGQTVAVRNVEGPGSVLGMARIVPQS